MQDRTKGFKLIKGARLIDGLGGPPVEDGAILVNGSRIVAVGAAREVKAPEGAEAETFDYPGQTVMPGMIDCHTHHNGFGDGRPGEDVAALPDEILTLQAARNAKDSLFSGVTTIRDNGAKNLTMFRLREAARMGIMQAPRMVLCGRPIAIVGGHMGYFGSEVTGAVEAAGEVRQLIKEGADYIKISATGGTTRTSFPLLPSFNVDELRAMTTEAHKFGKLTATHCSSTQGTINSLDAGVDMIIHCVFKDSDGTPNFRQDVAERMAGLGTYVNPTIHVARARVWALQARKESQGLTGPEEATLEEALKELEVRWTHSAKLIDLGLNIITGSDSSWGDYELGHTVYETECLVHAGMSAMQGLVSLTSDAAQSLAVDRVTGSLEPGKEADVIVVDGNPAEDISTLWKVSEVFLAGERVERGSDGFRPGARQLPPASRPELGIMELLPSKG